MVLIGPGALDGVDLEKKKFACLIVVEIRSDVSGHPVVSGP